MGIKRLRKPVALLAALALVVGLFPAYAVAGGETGGSGEGFNPTDVSDVQSNAANEDAVAGEASPVDEGSSDSQGENNGVGTADSVEVQPPIENAANPASMPQGGEPDAGDENVAVGGDAGKAEAEEAGSGSANADAVASESQLNTQDDQSDTYAVYLNNQDARGTASISVGSERMAAGETLIVSVTPKEGWKVSEVEFWLNAPPYGALAYTSTSAGYMIEMPNGPVYVTIRYAPVEGTELYSIEFADTAANHYYGSVDYYEYERAAGDTVVITPSADYGYRIESMRIVETGTGKEVPTSGAYNNTITMPASDVTVYATTVPAEDSGLAIGTSAGGSAEVAMHDVVGKGHSMPISPDSAANMSAIEGWQATLTATPEEGYRFAGWYKGVFVDYFVRDYDESTCYSTATSWSFEIGSDADPGTAYALFVQDVADEHTVTFDTRGGSAIASQTVADGEKMTKPADPEPPAGKEGLYFDRWNIYQPSELTYARCWNGVSNGGGVPDFNEPVTDDMTLYAYYWGVLAAHPYDLTKGVSSVGGTVKIDSVYNPIKECAGTQSIQLDGMEVTCTAQASDGYTFAGWSTSTSKSDIVSQDAAYTFVFEQKTTLYALFEQEGPTLTLHWSSIDGTDLLSPIVIEAEKSSASEPLTYAAALATVDAELSDEQFAKEGYKDYGLRIAQPLTSYDSWEAVIADNISADGVIEADTDIYYVMAKAIDEAAITVETPACGTKVSGDAKSQTNAPTVSVPADANYKLGLEGSAALPAYWVASKESSSVFEGTMTGGNTYYAIAWLSPAFGYYFNEGATATVDGGALVDSGYDQGDYRIVASVAPEHEWGSWEVVKEATEKEDGLKQRVCKGCGEVEQETISKIAVKYTVTEGDGGSYAKGSNTDLAFTVKRNVSDEKTFSLFAGILVDGNAVDKAQYTVASGSAIVTLKASYLETLSTGDHTMTAQFNDGEATAAFTVEDAAKPVPASESDTTHANAAKTSETKSTPKTGDPLLSWQIIAIVAAVAAAMAATASVAARQGRRD